MLEPFGASDDRHRLCFGAGVQLDDAFRAKPVDPSLLQPLRARLRKVPDHSQTGKVVVEANLIIETKDALHHRWHHVDDICAVIFNSGKRGLGIETFE